MNLLKPLLLLSILATSCDSNNRVTKKTEIIQADLNNSKYDVIPLTEIREVIRQAVDLPELQQYFHFKQSPERLPLKILEFGDINENTLKGMTKSGQPIKVITKSEIEHHQIKDYLGVGDWSAVNGSLRLQLDYPIEGIVINYMFYRKKGKLKIVDSVIFVN